jgi:hypothetical protein
MRICLLYIFWLRGFGDDTTVDDDVEDELISPSRVDFLGVFRVSGILQAGSTSAMEPAPRPAQ